MSQLLVRDDSLVLLVDVQERLAPAILRRVDGRTSLGAIRDALAAEGADAARAAADLAETCRTLEATNRLLLSAPSG